MEKEELFQNVIQGHKQALEVKKRMIYQSNKLGITNLEEMHSMQKELDTNDPITSSIYILLDNDIDDYEKLDQAMKKVEESNYSMENVFLQNSIVSMYMFLELFTNGELQ